MAIFDCVTSQLHHQSLYRHQKYFKWHRQVNEHLLQVRGHPKKNCYYIFQNSKIYSHLVPFSFIHFGIYDLLKEIINPKNEYSPSTNAFCGAVAGGLAAFVTTPLDVVKTVLNTQEGRLAAGVNCNPCPTGEPAFIPKRRRTTSCALLRCRMILDYGV